MQLFQEPVVAHGPPQFSPVLLRPQVSGQAWTVEEVARLRTEKTSLERATRAQYARRGSYAWCMKGFVGTGKSVYPYPRFEKLDRGSTYTV